MANKSEGAAEGILCDAEGHLLEGMLTNLFIVAGERVRLLLPVCFCASDPRASLHLRLPPHRLLRYSGAKLLRLQTHLPLEIGHMWPNSPR